MNALNHIAEWLTPSGMRMDTSDRWRAIRDWSDYSQNTSWLWLVLVIGFGALVAVGVVIALIARWPAQKRIRKMFGAQARSLGLNDAEQTLLDQIADRAGLKDRRTIFTMEQAVSQGAQELLTPGTTQPTPPQRREHLEATVVSLCQKLGFQSPLRRESDSAFDTRQIPRETRVLLVDEEDAVKLAATVAAVEPETLVLVADSPWDLAPPAHVVVRHGSQGMAREFDCELVSCQGRDIRLRHAPVARTLNLRRYMRVPTDQEAMVAEIGFFQGRGEMRAPSFVPARLKEIAGPGLLLHIPTTTTLPERLLVVTRLVDQMVVQGAASVRRVIPLDGVKTSVAVELELLDLGPRELAEMVRQTNLAARQAQSSDDPAGPMGPAPQGLAATMQEAT